MSWAEAAAPIVAEVIRREGRQNLRALRKALAAAYPWGERENTPYKAWLSEIRRQLGHPLNKPKADPANTQTDMFAAVEHQVHRTEWPLVDAPQPERE